METCPCSPPPRSLCHSFDLRLRCCNENLFLRRFVSSMSRILQRVLLRASAFFLTAFLLMLETEQTALHVFYLQSTGRQVCTPADQRAGHLTGVSLWQDQDKMLMSGVSGLFHAIFNPNSMSVSPRPLLQTNRHVATDFFLSFRFAGKS